MYVSRVHLHTELSSPSQAAAATARQLDADRKQLSQDAASGNMTAEIIDFVDISVDAVAVATTPPTTSISSTASALPSPDDQGATEQDLAAAQSPVTQVSPSTVVNAPDPLAAAVPVVSASTTANTVAAVHPGR